MRFSLDDYLSANLESSNGPVTVAPSISKFNSRTIDNDTRHDDNSKENAEITLDPELNRLVERLIVDINKLPGSIGQSNALKTSTYNKNISTPLQKLSYVEDNESSSLSFRESKRSYNNNNVNLIESLSSLL